MPFSGGSFSRLYSWVNERDLGNDIDSTKMDAEMDGMATGLSTAICRDGQSTITANIPFSNNKITGLGDATAATDALNRQTGDARYLELAGGALTVTSVSAAAVDCSLGHFFYKTASGNLTWTFTSVPSGGFGFILELTNGGAHTMTWPASVDWPAGVAPSLTSSGVDVLVFVTRDGGTTWRGVLSMRDSR
jgi:hypothetical protein